MSSSVELMYCLACGKDVENERGRRLLLGESSKHVLPLWSSLFGEEAQGRGVDINTMDFVKSGGKVCRSCFVALERCRIILSNMKACMSKAVDAGLNTGPVPQPTSRAYPVPATFTIPRTQSLAPRFNSPDVMVSLLYISYLTNK